MENIFDLWFTFFLLSRRGNRQLDVRFWWIRPVLFCRKMEKTRPVREQMDGKVLISRQNRHFLFVDNMIKILFKFSTLTWPANSYVSRQVKSIYWGNERIIIQGPFYHFTNQLIVYTATSCYPKESYFILSSLNKIQKKQSSPLLNIFLSKSGNIEKQEDVGGPCKNNSRRTS